MVELTVAQAATLIGKSKSTLTRAIKSGRLSAIRKDDGSFALDPVELHRAYPDAMRGAPDGASRIADSTVDDAAQRLEISALRDDLAAARQAAAVASALAEERARALEAAERNLADLRRLLPAPLGPVPPRPWWRFWS